MTIYVGGYTDGEHTNGLNVVEVEPGSGKISLVRSYAIEKPLYFASDAAGRHLFTNEKDGLGSFTIGADGSLTRCDFLSLEGKAMCHVATLGDRVTWAAYSNGKSGDVETKNGSFGKPVIYNHFGKGPNLPRQGASHPHCAVPVPDGKHFAVCDLGLDTVSVYPQATICETKPKGAGPRHILYHPNGELAFVIFELGDMVASYRCKPSGELTELLDERYTVGELAGKKVDPEVTVKSNGTAAAIRFSPDGKRVIVSNRLEHSLAVFDCDCKTGTLTHRATSVLPGSWPRDFIFLGDDLAFVAMERSGDLHTLRYDTDSARFTVLSSLGGFFRPVALLKK